MSRIPKLSAEGIERSAAVELLERLERSAAINNVLNDRF